MAKLRNKNVRHLCDSKDGLMSLYSAYNDNDKGQKPIIFIRGHAGKRTKNTKMKLDKVHHNNRLVIEHEGFWYDENIHKPYIAEFAYKDNIKKGLREYDKSKITTLSFAQSIGAMLEEENLKDVDVVGGSNGGSIGILTSQFGCIDRVSVVSPAIPSAFFADIDLLKKIKNNSIQNKVLYLISLAYMDQDYGFVKDMGCNFKDSEYVKNLIVPNKIFINAGSIKKIQSKNPIKALIELGNVVAAETICFATGKESDGAIVTDREYYDKLGIQYEITDDDYHFYCDSKEYLLKRAYQNLNKIHK